LRRALHHQRQAGSHENDLCGKGCNGLVQIACFIAELPGEGIHWDNAKANFIAHHNDRARGGGKRCQQAVTGTANVAPGGHQIA
jgi:hypothetical protein